MNTILCVEDEPHLRGDIIEELEDAGYRTLQAGDGREGIEMILAHKPDMVISDITMPRLSGYELVKELRENHPEFADMPFVFLSALADRKDILSGVELGGDDYLTKPVDFEMLLARVACVLRQSGRMIKQKQHEQVKLFRALNEIEPREDPDRQWPAMASRRIILVGKSDKDIWRFQRLLEELGHNVQVFTSGSAYLDKSRNGEAEANLTLLWFHSDDMQAPMIQRVAANKSGKYVMVMPERLVEPGKALSQPGFSDAIGLPIGEGELVEKVRAWTQ